MGKKPKIVKGPEDIEIRQYSGFKRGLSPFEEQAIQEFRELLFQAKKSTGVQFDTLALEPTGIMGVLQVDGPDSQRARDIGKALNVDTKFGNTVCVVNPSILVAAKRAKIPLQGALYHEAGHVVAHNSFVDAKLEKTINMLVSLEAIKRDLEYNRPESENRITDIFGSVDNFRSTLERLESKLLPVLNAIKSHDLFSAEYESMADARNQKDPRFISFKSMTDKLPGLKELEALDGKLYEARIPTSTDDIAPVAGPVDIKEPVLTHPLAVIIDRFGGMDQAAGLTKLRTSLSKSEELFADRFSQQTSSNPNSLGDTIEWFAKREVGRIGNDKTLDAIMREEGDTHPSHATRLAHLNHKSQNGPKR
jgi:hypothetical protein